MSFILDALRRADAQRESDSSRGIHAQAAPLPAPVVHRSRARHVLAWGAPALGVLALAVAAWQWRAAPVTAAGAEPASGAVPSGAAQAPVTPARVAASTAGPVQPADAIVPAAPQPVLRKVTSTAGAQPPEPRKPVVQLAQLAPGQVPGAAPGAVPAPNAERNAPPPGAPGMAYPSGVVPAPVAPSVPPAQDPALPAGAASSSVPTAPTGAPAAAAGVPTIPAVPVVPALPAAPAAAPGQRTAPVGSTAPAVPMQAAPAQRPSTVRPAPAPAPRAPAPPPATARQRSPLPSDAPAFKLSGGVYSRDPAQRMVIVNGQVFGPGSEPVPGVVVEEIRANSAVVRFRGQAYTIPY